MQSTPANPSSRFPHRSRSVMMLKRRFAVLLSLASLTCFTVRPAAGQAGSVLCWGYNGNGQLGDGTLATRSTAAPAYFISGVKSGSAGTAFTLALTSDGHVYSWGFNGRGQLGLGDTVSRDV